jgi:hypothetical protein
VTGTLNVGHGGTGAVTLTGVLTGNGTSAITASAVTQYDVLVGGASNAVGSVGPGSSGQVVQSGGNAANPAYSTATYPSTTTINQLLYSSANNVVGGVTAGDYGVLISSSSGVPSWLTNGTTGQILTATTSGTPSWEAPATSVITIDGDSGSMTGSTVTISGGTTGLTTTASSATMDLTGTLNVGHGGTGDASFTAYMPITGGTTTTAALQSVATGTAGYVLTYNTSSSLPTWQAVPGTSMAWTDEATSFNAVASNGYFITAGSVVATLPASPSQGNTISFAVDTTSSFEILANTGQYIRAGSAISASAGNAVNSARGDSLTLVYRSSDSVWIATSILGTWTIT